MSLQKKYFLILFCSFFALQFSANASVYKNQKVVIQDSTVLSALHSAALNALEKNTSIGNSQKEIIFQEEIKPYIYEIIPSHKVLKRSKNSNGSSLLNVLVELDVTSLYSSFVFNKVNLKDASLRAVVAVAGYEGGKPGSEKEYTEGERKLADRINSSIRAHLERRSFEFIPYSSEFSTQSYVGEDFDLDSTFKNIANKTDSNIVIFLEPKFKVIIKKPRNRRSMHFHIKSTVYERSSDAILTSFSKSTPMWLGKRSATTKNEKIVEKLERFINYFSHSIFRHAGTKYLANIHKSENLTLRVVAPPDYQSLEDFKKYLLRTLPSLESIMEKELRKGRVDYRVELGETKEETLISAVKSMKLESYSVFVAALTQDKVLSIHFEKKMEGEQRVDAVTKSSSSTPP